MKLSLVKFLSIFILIFSLTNAYAVDKKDSHVNKWWFDIGGGYGLASNNFAGNSTIMSLQYQFTHHQFVAVRIGSVLDSKGAFGKNGFSCYILSPLMCKADTGYTADTGAMYGWIEHIDSGYISAAIGVGYGQWEKNHIINQGLAFPIQIQNFWNIASNRAIGLIFYGSLNKNHSYGALGIAFQFGSVN